MGGSVRISPLGMAVTAAAALGIVYFVWPSSSPSSPAYSSTVSLKQLLSVAIEVAHRGGQEVKKIREAIDIGEKSKGKTREGANNPVTDGDMLSHRAMYYGILKAFPGLSVISEEHDPQPIDMTTIRMPSLSDPEVESVVDGASDELVPIEDVDVWIDPLDATQEYTENLLHYVTTMVCVAVRGRPVAGVIHKPFDGTTAWAWKATSGKSFVGPTLKAELDQRHPTDHRDLALSRIIVSRSHAGEVHDVAERAFGAKSTVTPAGGAGFKSWEVLRGEQDAYVHVTLIKKWDLCAGNAILNAAGGHMTTLDGASIDYSGRPAHEKNEGGVLATMHDHDAYVTKLKGTLKEGKKS